MRCPQCSSNLNFREAVSLPRLGRVRLCVCAFCGAFVGSSEERGPLIVLDACTSCGAPHEESESDGRAECRPCRAGASLDRDTAEAAGESSSRMLKEALRLWPAVDSRDAAAYFAHVLAGLEAVAHGERGSFRLVPVAELGFRALSLPGGTILAGDELLRALEDEACLAFVLAREIEHQQSGRVARRFRSRRPSGALAASLGWGLGLLTWGAFAPGRAEAELLNEVAVLGYGPAQEQDADERATKLIAAAGYDPAAAVRFLSMFEKRHLDARGALAAFLDVHPVRSRRRCLVETLVALQGPGRLTQRLNREVYRRAVASIGCDDPVRTGARASAAEEPALRP